MIFLLFTLAYINESEYERAINQSITKTVCAVHHWPVFFQLNDYFRCDSLWKTKLIWIIPSGIAFLLIITIPNVITSLKYMKNKNTADTPTTNTTLTTVRSITTTSTKGTVLWNDRSNLSSKLIVNSYEIETCEYGIDSK